MSKGGQHKSHYWMKEPESCACLFGRDPSPWHCACGRWKRSGDAACQVCVPTVMIEVPQRAALRTLDEHWSDYWRGTAAS